jgi:hypothetical protein
MAVRAEGHHLGWVIAATACDLDDVVDFQDRLSVVRDVCGWTAA